MRFLLGTIFLAAACSHPAPAPVCPTAPQSPPAATAATTAGDASAPVAKIGDRVITMAELDKAAGHELYDLRESTLDKMISERVLELAAKAAGEPVEIFLAKQVEARVPEVTEKTAREFFDKNKDRLPPELASKKFEDVKPILIRGLTEQARRDGAADVISELRAKAGVRVLLEAPKVNVAASGPAKGPASAKVTIVEFSDFQCPFCARGKAVMDQVVKTYGNDVRLVFRDFPLSFHEHAEKAAEAGHCADEQGKFWEMHDWMFDNQKSLESASLKGAAKKLGLDAKKFDACLDTGKYAEAVALNQKAGEEAGVKGTPAFFINGTSLSGAQPFEKFKNEIDRALGR
jgi:protein-disulfide isomerase